MNQKQALQNEGSHKSQVEGKFQIFSVQKQTSYTYINQTYSLLISEFKIFQTRNVEAGKNPHQVSLSRRVQFSPANFITSLIITLVRLALLFYGNLLNFWRVRFSPRSALTRIEMVFSEIDCDLGKEKSPQNAISRIST